MSEALDRLKDIGAQKIYEDTHIPVEHVQEILYESFDGLNKIQFVGFISILEREYGEDLSAVRASGIGYFDEKNPPNEAITNDAMFKPSSKKKNLTLIYIIFAIILLAIAIFYTMQSAGKTLQSSTKENKIIQKVQKNIVVDVNRSENDSNVSEPQKIREPKAVAHTLQIIARTKVWLGYIDVATDRKYQKTFEGAFNLDPSKEWLFYFGHGYIDVVLDGKKEVFNSNKTLRLHYQDGNITKISLDDFKKLNRGSTW